MHYNNNNRIDRNTHASRNNIYITFSSTITVGKNNNRNNNPNAPIPRRLEPINFNNCHSNPTKVMPEMLI